MIDRQWATLAVNLCVAHGIDHFFVAPGSRCTPLTLAIAQHEELVVTQHFDERGLAFAALGYARASGKPGVFVCTSGTAVANALPAVVEASTECLPMLLFTADRPPELRNTGANQTIDQQKIYGNYARWFFDMPCPDAALGNDFLSSQLERAFVESTTGPVHLNWMFREPFGLEEMPHSAFAGVEVESDDVDETPHAETIVTVNGDTLLLAGRCMPREAMAIRGLAEQHGLPLVTDITSGLRGISPDIAVSSGLPEPDTIVHLGGRVVSKSWLQYTSSLSKTKFIHVTAQDVQINPNHLALERHVTGIEGTQLHFHSKSSRQFQQAWDHAESSRRRSNELVLDEFRDRLTEPRLAFDLGRMLEDGHALFVGNSSPIRDLDRFAVWRNEKDVVVAANRGASGIDGLVATAVGFAMGHQRPTTVVLGDLSMLHDLNSLALVAACEMPLTIVVVNNQGGAIFDMLPVAKRTEAFEQYFITPHTFDFRQAAGMFSIPYQQAETVEEFNSAYANACSSTGPVLIEAKTERKENQLVRQRVQEVLGT